MPRTKTKPATNGHAPPAPDLVCPAASEFEPRNSTWLWKPLIPNGGITMVDGPPGQGKSTVLIDLAARVTRGDPMPDGSRGTNGTVLLMFSEDDAYEDASPRLLAAGAVMTKVSFPGRTPGTSAHKPPRLPGGIGQLAQMASHWRAKLIIIDPYVSFLEPGLNRNDEQDVRRALEPLNQMAQDLRLAVALVRHPNKDTSQDPLYRGAGSLGITAIARSVLWTDQDATHPARSALAKIKGNRGKRTCAFAFELVQTVVVKRKEQIETVKVVWFGEAAQGRAEQVRQEEEAVEKEERNDAEELLKLALRDGWVSATDLLKQATLAGISERSLKRAKARLKIPQRWNTEATPRFSEWGVPPAGWHP